MYFLVSRLGAGCAVGCVCAIVRLFGFGYCLVIMDWWLVIVNSVVSTPLRAYCLLVLLVFRMF